jgi:uncharacterized protein (TIGR03545 family)
MIRWRFIITRTLIVVAVILLLRYTLSPIAKYVTVRALQAITGAKVDIAMVHVGLFPPSVRYEGLEVADPRDDKSRKNAISAESVAFEIDGDAFLHRRYVVRNGQVTGLRIGSDRMNSGHFEPQPAPEASTTSPWMSQLVDSLVSMSGDRLETFGKELEMTKRAELIRRRWQGEYASLTKRAEDLEASVKELRDTARSVDNPLRDIPRIEAALRRAKEIQAELVAVRNEIDQIPAKAQEDLLSMQKAKDIDLAKIEEITSFDISGSDNFGPQLLAGIINRQVDRMREYVDAGREIADWTVAAPEVERERGETFDLVRGIRKPSMLIQRCEVNGELQSDGKPYQLSGIVENITSQPKLREQPFRARLKLEGPQVVRLDYSRDDSSTIVRESLTMHWPEIPAPRMRMGDADSFALEVSGGRMELWAQLDSTGDTVQGRVVSRRVDTKIDLQSSPKIAKTAIVTNLSETLAAVDRLEIDANFVGTWADMDIAISTNLTQMLKTGMNQAIAAQVTASRDELTAKLNETYTAQMEELQSFVNKEQAQARSLLAKADSTVQEFSEKVLSETGAAESYLGRLRNLQLK